MDLGTIGMTTPLHPRTPHPIPVFWKQSSALPEARQILGTPACTSFLLCAADPGLQLQKTILVLQEHRPDLQDDSPGSCTGSHVGPRDPRGQTNLDITNCTHSPELHILVYSFERFQFYQGPGLI